MAFKVTQDAAKVYLTFTLNSQVFGVTFWFKKPGFDSNDLQVLANLVLNAHTTSDIMDYISEDITVGPAIAYDMRSSDGDVLYSNIGAMDGNDVSERLPLSDCVCTTLYTEKRGRSHRGRVYYSGFCEAQNQDGVFSMAIGIGIAEAHSNMMNAATAAGWQWGVRSAWLNGVERDPAIVTPISSSIIRNLIPASQRRRDKRP
jgi:hypothetical protein